MITATPIRLYSGAWGVRTTVPVKSGDSVMVFTNSGKRWPATIDVVQWTDGRAMVASTIDNKPTRRSRRQDLANARTFQPGPEVTAIIAAAAKGPQAAQDVQRAAAAWAAARSGQTAPAATQQPQDTAPIDTTAQDDDSQAEQDEQRRDDYQAEEQAAPAGDAWTFDLFPVATR